MKTSIRFSGTGIHIISVALALSLLAVIFFATPVQAAPALNVSPNVGAAGTITTISGSLFDSYKGDTVYILFDGTQVEYSPFSVPETGTFEIPFTIPSGKGPGKYQILATTNPFDALNIAEAWFTIEAIGIHVDIGRGPVGTAITISGSGFHADTAVTLYYHNPSPVAVGEETASELGRFDHQYVIPDSVSGPHMITATNVYGDQAEVNFEVVPAIFLNIDSGGPGETVRAIGTGFGSQKNFTITMGTREVASGVTDELGGFEFDFYIPTLKSNTYDVVVLDTDNNQDTVKFTVTAGASLSKTTGPVGASLTVRGEGFKPGGAITIMFDDIEVGTATADNNGAFSSTITVPAAASGQHTVSISDGTTVKEFPFTIESVAPPAPVLVSPANSSQTGSRVSFDWDDVTDDSPPVTYRLQVATDSAFDSLFLDEPDLTASGYTVDGLPSSNTTITYYWRVSSEDGAGNVGDWSDAWTFYINPIQAPVLSSAVVNEDNMQVLLDWTDITSPDGQVTYTLEVSGDQGFSARFIDEAGLTVSSYTIAGPDYTALESNTPYYWRVRSTDEASNESGWSSTGTFTIEASASSSGFPTWGIIVIAAIGIIIIGYLAFRMGRRTAYGGEQ